MNYFAEIDGHTVGPLPKWLLGARGLTKNTPVWTAANPQHVAAATVPELSAMLDLRPGPGEKAPDRFYVSLMKHAGFNSTNAHLFVFDDYICIEPQRALSIMSANFSKSGYMRQYIGLHEVTALQKGFMARRHIKTIDGRDIVIGTWKRAVFDAIETRRDAHFKRRGIPAPPLKK